MVVGLVAECGRGLLRVRRQWGGGRSSCVPRCSFTMPTTCSTKVPKGGKKLPSEGRDESIQTKTDNQTHRFLAKLASTANQICATCIS